MQPALFLCSASTTLRWLGLLRFGATCTVFFARSAGCRTTAQCKACTGQQGSNTEPCQKLFQFFLVHGILLSVVFLEFPPKAGAQSPYLRRPVRNADCTDGQMLSIITARVNRMSSIDTPYFPNTVFKRSVARAAGSFLIFFSSSPTMKNKPSSALFVT